eukprot:GHVR01193356.1.p1 GENE.GHVR01193356.1~~GHVR01193356.1.p1  ORF type:complete len:164 (+),score=24.65 GHVR01193356.1:245-736(+)
MSMLPPGPTNRLWCKALIKPTGSFFTSEIESGETVENFRIKFKALSLSFTTPTPDEVDCRVPDLVFNTTDSEMDGYVNKFKPEDRKFVRMVLKKIDLEQQVDVADAEKYVLMVSKLTFNSTAGPRDFPSLVSNSRARFNALKNERDYDIEQNDEKKRKLSQLS